MLEEGTTCTSSPNERYSENHWMGAEMLACSTVVMVYEESRREYLKRDQAFPENPRSYGTD